MNKVHIADKADRHGMQRCVKCNYLLKSNTPYFRPGAFVAVGHIGAFGVRGCECFDLCNAPAEAAK